MQYPIDDATNVESWHLTPEQIEQFDTLGFIKLRNRIPSNLLSKLQHESKIIEQQAAHWLSTNARRQDFFVTTNLFSFYLNRLLHFHRYAEKSALAIMGCPHFLAPAQSLCGLDCVPCADTMVFKHPNTDSQMPWHQDLIYPSSDYKMATFGIYLDDANQHNGAITFIPATQHQHQNICQFEQQPPLHAQRVDANAGDIIIHNPMIVHSSVKNTAKKRRTLYYQMRPLQALLDFKGWTRQLIHNRLSLLFNAANQYQLHFSQTNETPLNLKHCDDWRCQPIDGLLDELYRIPLPLDNANYCQPKGRF